jgi:hypothetical protein
VTGDDASPYPKDWTDARLHEAIHEQFGMALDATESGFRLGFLAGARALIDILAERAERLTKLRYS